MANESMVLEDMDLKDTVLRNCEWHDGENVKRKTRQKPVSEIFPEELMGQLEQYIGNGGGHVTVAGELSHSKQFGCSAKSFVSVSVTCDGSLEVCQAVHDLVQPMVRNLINEDLQMMKDDRDAVLDADPPDGYTPRRIAGPAPTAQPVKPNFGR
jgi:hypothetical protein